MWQNHHNIRLMTLMYIMPLFIGTSELILIAGVVLLLFGGKKLPEMMRGLGQGLSEFKKAANEVTVPVEESKAEIKQAVDDAVESANK